VAAAAYVETGRGMPRPYDFSGHCVGAGYAAKSAKADLAC
jgi:hypothetical protein